MRAVEIAVREAADLSDAHVGVKLMRAAFDTSNGLLSDMEAEGGEHKRCRTYSRERWVTTRIPTLTGRLVLMMRRKLLKS